MIGHLGPKISALLDGQLSAADEERAWAHVHGCHECRDQVEHEGWVKTQLVELSFGTACASPDLKGSLLVSGWGGVPADVPPAQLFGLAGRSRRLGSLSALGGGAVGAAVMGVLALGAASPANAPTSISPGAGWGTSLTENITSIVDRTYGPQVRAVQGTGQKSAARGTGGSHAPAADGSRSGGSGLATHASNGPTTDTLTRVLRRTLTP